MFFGFSFLTFFPTLNASKLYNKNWECEENFFPDDCKQPRTETYYHFPSKNLEWQEYDNQPNGNPKGMLKVNLTLKEIEKESQEINKLHGDNFCNVSDYHFTVRKNNINRSLGEIFYSKNLTIEIYTKESNGKVFFVLQYNSDYYNEEDRKMHLSLLKFSYHDEKIEDYFKNFKNKIDINYISYNIKDYFLYECFYNAITKQINYFIKNFDDNNEDHINFYNKQYKEIDNLSKITKKMGLTQIYKSEKNFIDPDLPKAQQTINNCIMKKFIKDIEEKIQQEIIVDDIIKQNLINKTDFHFTIFEIVENFLTQFDDIDYDIGSGTFALQDTAKIIRKIQEKINNQTINLIDKELENISSKYKNLNISYQYIKNVIQNNQNNNFKKEEIEKKVIENILNIIENNIDDFKSKIINQTSEKDQTSEKENQNFITLRFFAQLNQDIEEFLNAIMTKYDDDSIHNEVSQSIKEIVIKTKEKLNLSLDDLKILTKDLEECGIIKIKKKELDLSGQQNNSQKGKKKTKGKQKENNQKGKKKKIKKMQNPQ